VTALDASNPGARTVPRSWVICLAFAAFARLLLQVLAMPPYAGLDEVYHVARVAFVVQEGKQPASAQNSVPLYLAKSTSASPDAPPAFGVIASGWPAVVAARPEGWRDVPLARQLLRVYVSPNYEAQQPSLYYGLVAPFDHVIGTTQLRELLLLRLFAVLCGVVTVLATGFLAARFWGRTGFLAGVFLLALPTWITLVARAGNDAPACAALALGLLFSVQSVRGGRAWIGEALAWALAVALKLTTWPAALLLPLLWPKDSSRARRAVVACVVLASAGLTALDLASRTGNPVGDQALWQTSGTTIPGSALTRLIGLPWLDLVKIFVGQAIWTSGQHANFLRPLGLALYLLPWLVLLAVGLRARGHLPASALRLLAASAFVFAFAQAGHAYGFFRDAIARGHAPLGGMEGWYVHAFDPLWIGVGLGALLVALERPGLAPLFGLALAGVLAGDVLLHEGALFCDYAGLSSPLTPGRFFRWGGGTAWEALTRLGRYGLALPSPWIAVLLRGLQLAAVALLVALALGAARRGKDHG